MFLWLWDLSVSINPSDCWLCGEATASLSNLCRDNPHNKNTGYNGWPAWQHPALDKQRFLVPLSRSKNDLGWKWPSRSLSSAQSWELHPFSIAASALQGHNCSVLLLESEIFSGWRFGVSQMSQSRFYSLEGLWWVTTLQAQVNRVVSVAYLDLEQLCCSFLRGCQVKLKALSIWPFAGITPTMAYSTVSTVAVVITMDFTLRMQIEFLIVGFNPGWAVITREFCSCWSILGSCKSQKYCSKVRNAIYVGRKKGEMVIFRARVLAWEGKGSRLCETGQV